MPAENLEDAFNELDPHVPVTAEQVDTIFVERPGSQTEAMREHLSVAQRPVKLLFVGHRGAGKSSELTYLASLLQGRFVSVPIPLYSIFQSPDISHAEVVFAMNLRLLQKASDESVVPRGVLKHLWEGHLRDRVAALRRWLLGEKAAGTDDLGQEAGRKLLAFATGLERRIGTEAATRQQVRAHLETQLSEIIAQIGDLAIKLKDTLKKGLLVLVEDLDKFDREQTANLFLGHSRTLTMPNLNVVYSFPVAMRYTDDFPEIQKAFDGTYFLPNMALVRRGGESNPNALEAARRVITNRVSAGLFQPDALGRLVAMSGGHVKTLVQLAQQAVLSAIVAKAESVTSDHLQTAAAKLRDDYVTLLSREQLQLLKQMRDDPNKDLAGLDEARQRLLYNGSLLEYGNTRGPWGGVNPIVAEILDRDEH